MSSLGRKITSPAVSGWAWHKLLDAILFGLFVYDGFSAPGLPIAIPVSELSVLGLVAISLFRRSRQRQSTTLWVLALLTLILVFLVFSSIANDVDWFRRATRFVFLVALLWVISTGRVNLRAGLAGMALALTANLALFYVGLAPDNYGGVLTGFLGDKNVAGLYYTVFPLLIAASASSRRIRAFILLCGAIAIFLTGSRTSLGAYAAAVAWLVFSAKLPRAGRIMVGGLLIVGLQYVEANLARIWIFSDREGSDSLRERIGQAAEEKTDSAPWYGLGLGEARVEVDGRLWFFHDSYLGLMAEGGAAFLVVVVAAYVLTGLRPFSRQVRTREILCVEAATIAFLVCAWKLGEVFLSIPGFVLLGYAMALGGRSLINKGAKKVSAHAIQI